MSSLNRELQIINNKIMQVENEDYKRHYKIIKIIKNQIRKQENMLGYRSCLTFLISLSILVSNAFCSLNLLRVILNNSAINAVSTHTWTVNFTTTISRSEFTLYFPTCVSFQPTTNVMYSGVTLTNISVGTSSINLNLSSPITSSMFVFTVNNVNNCFYAAAFRNLVVYTPQDGNLSFPTMSPLNYVQGSILSCSLKFNDETGAAPSHVNISFKIQNAVRGNVFRVMLRWPVYFSSITYLTWYNNPTNTPLYNLVCNLLINDTIIAATEVLASITFSNKTLFCNFDNILTAISSSDNLILKLDGITNPTTSTIYASATDFILNTLDVSWNIYDQSLMCTPLPVTIAQYNATFFGSQIINNNFSSIQLTTAQLIPIRIAKNDQILMRYSEGSFSSCSGNLYLFKIDVAGSLPRIFIEQTTSISLAKQYTTTSENLDGNSTLNILFENCNFLMPPSSLPVTFTLQFSGTSQTPGSYDHYMQINAVLQPLVSPMLATQVSLVPSITTMGDLSTYTFTINLGQPLTQTPSIRIDFPALINLADANTIATLSSCSVIVSGIGVGSRTCQYLPSNSILVNFTFSSPLGKNTVISISIQNIRNPSGPSSISNFSITTFYTLSQPSGVTEQGINIIDARNYTERTIYPQVLGTNFTVYTSGTTITISYLTGVDIVSGSITTLTFTGNLSELANFVPAPTSQSGSTYQFNMPNTPLNTNIQFSFTCLTPSKTGIYQIVSIETKFNGKTYEKTASPVTFEVTKPFVNNFNVLISNADSITGKTTQYSFEFSTIVPHPTNFILQITFPSNTNFLNGQSTCRLGCSLANITDTSSGGIDRIEVSLTSASTYAVKITNITNQRQLGISGNFQFRTLTKDTARSLILSGTGTINIQNANILSAKLQQSDDYFKSNANPVHIQINVTNKLVFGDKIQLTFPPSSYILNGAVSCAEGNCSSDISNPSALKVIVFPSATQVITTSINLQIYGLISAANTQPLQIVPITIQTYSSASRLMDQGVANYFLDCQYSSVIRDKSCKTCSIVSGVDVCTSCYTPIYSIYQNSQCTNACGNRSQYQTFPNSGVCKPCLVPCVACYNETNCTKCIAGFYHIADLDICLSSCSTSAGYYVVVDRTFNYCIRCSQPNCTSCPNNICDACNVSFVLLGNRCTGGCTGRTYNLGGVCRTCHDACSTCDGPSDFDCLGCSLDYFPISGGQCVNQCPYGSVMLSSNVCGCEVPCSTCTGSNTSCLSCLDSNFFLYNFSCYSPCPNATYAIGQQCFSCTSGCQRCSSTTCTQCASGYGIFENRCYLDCKQLGPRYVSMLIDGIYRCNECPAGCSQCNFDYQCSVCLATYTLNGTVCKRQCQLTNTCDDAPVVDSIIPLPGFLSFFVLTIGVVIFKIITSHQMYVPYVLLFSGALIEFIQVAATLGSVDSKMKSLISARLLQTETLPSYYPTCLGLLAVALALNYIMNAISIWIFCKFIKPMILPRQIDKISNYVVFIFSLFTTYRFYLLAYSRLFKKPFVEVKNQAQLKTLHIILAASYILDILPLTAAFMLAINSLQLSILYMLGIDLILIIFICWIIFAWVIFRPKPIDYYYETKKYGIRENHITEEGSIFNDKQASKTKMGTNQKIQVEEYIAEENVDDMPTKQANIVKIAAKNQEKIQNGDKSNSNNPKTQRKEKKTLVNSNSEQKQHFNEQSVSNQYMQQKSERKNNKPQNSRDDQLSNQKQVKDNHKINSDRVVNQRSANNLAVRKLQFEQAELDDESDINQDKRRKQQPQRLTKYKPGPRSTTMRMESVTGMKKKKNIGNFESEIGDSNVDEVDLQAIIQSKLVDRSKLKQRDTRTEADKNESRNQQYEQISPSWFNVQNQRYDIEDKDDQ